MKRTAIIIFLMTISFASTFGQTTTDSISMNKVFGGYQFYQGNQRLTMNQLANAMRQNEQAYNQMKSARSSSTLAAIIGGVGGYMVGYPIGTAIGGGDPNWTMAGIGAALIAIAIPISSSSSNKAKQAADIYNAGLQPISYRDKSELRFSMSENGVGLTLRF